jgi:hypothetical protein
MNIDHVTIAGSNLDSLRESFARMGLATDYGGPHANGVTHMALLGFDDGSYIELISTLEQKKQPTSYWWERFITGDGGPCSWAIAANDVSAEAKRITRLGIPVRGPQTASRQRPDGRLVEWDSAFIGEGDPGTVLPFIIKDRTPREWRVAPSASVTGSELRGIVRAVILASDLSTTSSLFRKVYGARESPRDVDANLSAELQTFDNMPAIVARALNDPSPLMSRLKAYGDCPLAFLIGSADMEQTRRRFPAAETGRWFGEPVLWLPNETTLPWLGVIAG